MSDLVGNPEVINDPNNIRFTVVYMYIFEGLKAKLQATVLLRSAYEGHREKTCLWGF